MNETQQVALEDCLETVVDYVSVLPNGVQLLTAILEQNVNSPNVLQLLNQNPPLPVPLQNCLINARKLVLGDDLMVVRNANGYVALQPTNTIPFKLSPLCVIPITSAEIQQFSRNYIGQALANLNQAQQAVNVAMQQAIIQIMPANPLPNLPNNNPPNANPNVVNNNNGGWLDAIKNFFFGVGRGIQNFFMRLAFPFLHPLLTIKGLAYAIQHPIEVFQALKDRFTNYATNDPVAFGTEVVINLLLIAATIASIGATAAPSAAVIAAEAAETTAVIGVGAALTTARALTMTIAAPAALMPVVLPMAAPAAFCVAPIMTLIPAAAPVAAAASVVGNGVSILATAASSSQQPYSAEEFAELTSTEKITYSLQDPNNLSMLQKHQGQLTSQYLEMLRQEAGFKKADRNLNGFKINLFESPQTIYVDGSKPKFKINLFDTPESVQMSQSAEVVWQRKIENSQVDNLVQVGMFNPTQVKLDESTKKSGNAVVNTTGVNEYRPIV